MYDKKALPDMAGSRPDVAISLVRFDAMKEMDILRSVLRRDSLIALLAEQRRASMVGDELCLKAFFQALVEAREASLEVIEAVTRWRCTLIKPEGFIVRGGNYVTAMSTDMDFLATGLTPLKEAFGLEFGKGNPFALPCLVSTTAIIAVKNGSQGRKSGAVGVETKDGEKVLKGRPKPAVRSASNDAGRDTTRARRVRPVTSNTKKDTDDLPMPTVTNLASNNSHTASARDGLEHGKGCDPPQSTDDRKLEESGEESCSRDTTTLRELILRLGDVDDAQRDRLARAQISIEEEVARTSSLPAEKHRWGFHRWLERSWTPHAHLTS